MISLTSQLKSLAFVPETMAQGLGVIQFYSFYDPYATKETFIAANQPEVTYRVNPANADLANVEWAFINREVTTKVAGDNTDLISIVGEPVAGEKGGVVFTITANSDKEIPSDASAKGENILVALQATSTDSEEEVVSDYALVEQTKINEYEIIKYAPYYAKTKNVIAYKPTDDYKVLPDLADETNITLAYNETINVIDSLETYVPTKGIEKSLPEMYVEPSYKLSFPEEYLGADKKTNQQKFVTLDEEGNLSVNSEWLDSSRPAIGRTPVIFVEAFVKNTEGRDVKVAQCWLKVNIIGEKAVIKDHNVTVAPATIEYSEIPDAGKVIALNWEQANKDILDALDLTYNEFVALYDVDAANVTVTYYDAAGKELKDAPAGVSASISGMSNNTATNAAEVTITDKVDENLSGSVKVEIPSVEPNSRGNVIVTFSYTVKHEHVWPELSANYLKPGTTNTVQVKGKLNAAGDAWVMQSTIAEHFDSYLQNYSAAYAKNKENHGPITFALMPYVSKDEAAKNGKVVSVATPQAEWPKGYVDQLGAAISGRDYTNQEIALTDPLVNSKIYVVTAYTVLDNGNYCEMTYYVEFVSPFEVAGKDIELKTLIADPSVENVQDLLTIKDLDGKVVYEKGAVTKYGADTYKLDDTDFVFDYELIFKDADHPDLNPKTDFSKDGHDYLTVDNGTDEISWYNGGTTLQQDMHAAYSIELQVSDICVVDTEAGITVLSSANSK